MTGTSPVLLSHKRVATALCAVVLSLLGACASSPRTKPAPPGASPSSSTAAPSGPIADPSTQQHAAAPVVLRGTGVLARVPSPAAPHAKAPADGEGFQLNFVDTDIAAVVASVIGDGLGLPYSVDPQVKGNITLQATRPLSRDEIPAALEAALRLQGAALLAVNGGYSVVPMKDAARQVSGFRAAGDRHAGYGIQIVPLQYVSAADMEKVLKPFAPEGAILRADESRNLLVLAGSSQEIGTLLAVVETFDVDWLAGMSFEIYPLQYAEARTLADELAHVFEDQKSPIGSLVKLVPLARLNSIVVMTHQPQYLQKIEAWIKQLDVGTTAPGRRLYVFDVQNGKAKDLASSLSRILSLPVDSSDTDHGDTGGSASALSTIGGTASQPAAYGETRSTPPTARSTRGESGATGVGGMKIVPNEESNSLLIFASADEYALIEKALTRLDVEPIQVLIEASLAEVTLNDELRFGLQWAYQSGSGPITLSQSAGGAIAQQFPGFSYLYTGSKSIQAVLSSLETLTNVNVISSPKLLVLNNHEAQLQVGDQVPIATQSSVSTVGSNAPIVNSVQLLDTGVILRVTPRVNKNGLVLLDIAQEVSDVVPTTSSTIDSPTIQQRKLSSSVAVHDGETIAMGGLIRDSRSKSRGGIPLLTRIPVLGALFGSTDNTHTRTELVVLLTPHVLRSGKEAAAMMEELHEEFRALRKPMPGWQKPDDTAKPDAQQP